jgi:hypothetical protein
MQHTQINKCNTHVYKRNNKKLLIKLGIVIHTCNPSCLEDRLGRL